MTDHSKPSLNYQAAGVDIDRANELIEAIKPLAAETQRPEVLNSLGGFGALCQLPSGYQEPVLVSGTDGVGTKLKLALETNQHTGIGVDLVAMCVNDIICHGAEPLFFLDYYATGELNPAIAKSVITGIAQGCKQAGCALIGGETAELPGLYQGNDYDLAGFAVGVVERSKIIHGERIQAGDILIALASSGPHANGYSLIRKVLETQGINLDTTLGGTSLQDILLAPTKIYAHTVNQLLNAVDLRGIAHITGGGLLENLPRILPIHTRAKIHVDSWQWPEIFTWLQEKGNVDTQEMYRTFNLGVGLVICVPSHDKDRALDCLKDNNETAWVIGEVLTAEQQQARVELQ